MSRSWKEAYLLNPNTGKTTLLHKPYNPNPNERLSYKVEGVYLMEDKNFGMSESEKLRTITFLQNIQALATAALGLAIYAGLTGTAIAGITAASAAAVAVVAIIIIVVIAVLIIAFGGSENDALKGMEKGLWMFAGALLANYAGGEDQAKNLTDLVPPPVEAPIDVTLPEKSIEVYSEPVAEAAGLKSNKLAPLALLGGGAVLLLSALAGD